MRRFLFCAFVMAIVAFVASGAFAQDDASGATQPAAPQAQAAAPAAPAAPAAAAPEAAEAPKPVELSIYGEVQNVNAQANSMVVQYYDYDNDEEKSTEITLDGNSKLENAKVISDIKKGDWVDVTYSSVNGKNVAKMVSVEKEEPMPEESTPAAEEQ